MTIGTKDPFMHRLLKGVRRLRAYSSLGTLNGDPRVPVVSASGSEIIGYATLAEIANAGASDAVTFDDIVTFQTAHSGLLHGSGASAAYHALGATADNAMEYYLNSTHTTGDMRGMYLRLRFSAAGGSGEALRAFGEVNGVTAATGGTVNGAHISLSLTGAAAAISGAGNALRATLGIGTGVTAPGGTQAVIQVDTDIASGVTPATGTAFLRFTNSGAVSLSYLMRTPNVASGGMLAAHVTDAMSHSLRCITEGGTTFYVMCTTTADNRTGGA